MNDDQLSAFIATANKGSLRKAANDLFLSVPSVSHRISSLESELGYDLFDRNQQGMSLTPQGQSFLETAHAITNLIKTAKNEASGNDQKHLRIGVWRHMPAPLSPVVPELQKQGLYIDVIKVDPDEASRKFSEGSIDAYFHARMTSLDVMGLRFTPLFPLKTYCAISPESPLASHDAIDIDAIEDKTVYAGQDWRDSPELRPYAAFFERDNVIKTSVFEEKIIADCLQDVAVSFFGKRQAESPGFPLVIRPMNLPPTTFGIYTRANAGEHMKAFVAGCKDALPENIDDIDSFM